MTDPSTMFKVFSRYLGLPTAKLIKKRIRSLYFRLLLWVRYRDDSFSPEFYLDRYPDVLAADADPYEHTVLFSGAAMAVFLEKVGLQMLEIRSAEKVMTMSYLLGQLQIYFPRIMRFCERFGNAFPELMNRRVLRNIRGSERGPGVDLGRSFST